MIVSQASIFAYQKCLTPLKSTIHCPARTTDNRDVLIRLMAVGEDRGERHRINHAVPVLQELVHDDMIFAVFPLLSWGFDYPWFYRFSEVVDAVEQVLEVTIFSNLLEFCTEFI